VVDPSLLRQANDRGVTIAFADLDGADGLWVPEERTVLVSRKLTEAEVARVIEHELTHVMIDDQHADLDAGKDVLVGRPPARSRRWAAAALTAAAIVATVGGVVFGIARATGGPPKEQVAPTLPGLTASESPPVVIASRGPDGQIVYVTVGAGSRPPGSTPTPTPAPTVTRSSSPSATVAPKLPGRPSATVAPTRPATVSPTPGPPSVSTNPPTVDPTPDPTTPEPPPSTPAEASLPAGDGAGAGAGSSDAGAPDGTADQPGAADSSDVVVAGSGGVDPVVDPDG
jgi:hypothetical protein